MGQDTNKQNSVAPDNSQRTPLWEFISLDEYTLPTVLIHKSASKAWQFFQKIFRRKNVLDGPIKKEYNFYSMPQVQLANLVPSLLWEDVAAALDTKLHEWILSDCSKRSIKFFIGQTFSGHNEIVSLLGKRHQAVEIKLPSIEQILSNEKSWFDNWPASENLWVLPKLERCYLRHAKGLNLVRQLLSLAVSGHLGKGLIGCGSWAWAYIQRIFLLPQADAITLQAFDAKRLQSLIYDLMKSELNADIYYNSGSNDQEIANKSLEEKQLQKEFEELAAYCRGNVAIAITYWRNRLRYEPDENEPDENKMKIKTGETKSRGHLWITAMPPEPELPVGNNDEFCILLHTIMLHHGLPDSLVGELLPFSEIRCRGILGQMEQAGIVYFDNSCWQVSEMAYIAIRKLLNAHGYLTDSF